MSHLEYHLKDGTAVEFLRREVVWKDGLPVGYGEESPISVADAWFIIEQDRKEREYEKNREVVRETAARLRTRRGR